MTGKNILVVSTKSIKDLLECYSSSLKAMNRSAKTISWYIEILTRYFTFLESCGLLRPVGELCREEIKLYIVHLQKASRWPDKQHVKGDKGKLSPFTIQGHVRAIKAFWSWLYEEGYLEDNPLVKLSLPKVPQNTVKTLTLEQIRKLLNVVDRYTPVGVKYYCAVLLFIDTGIRVSELVGIRLSDIDMLHGFVTVTGEGEKQRTVPFHKVTRKELLRYIKHFRLGLCQQESPYLFPEAGGDHISVTSVQQFIRRLVKKAGIEGVKCSPHIFRHTFATMYLAKGGSDLTLMNILGHASLQSTQKYVHLQPQDLQCQHAKYSPIESLF